MLNKVTSADVHVGRDGWLFFLTGSNNLIGYYNDPELFGDDLVNRKNTETRMVMNLDKEYIERVKPDIVVTETIERFMPVLQTDGFRLEEYARDRLKEYKSRHNYK
ncbi:MAG: hypothetical protein HZC51_00450 [Nitrospirae bacterium]|nr:hypothetical protein [Nitrospirota bacterium]